LLTINKIKQCYESQQYHINKNNKRHDSNVYDYVSNHPSEPINETSIVKEETSVRGTVSVDVWLKLFTSDYGWNGSLLLFF
jgi:hypothetical protein